MIAPARIPPEPRCVHSKHANFCPDCLGVILRPTGAALGFGPILMQLRCAECGAEFFPEWSGFLTDYAELDCYAQPH